MELKKYHIIIVVLLAFSQNIFAQQDAQFTQYMYNTQTINPGYTGSRGVLSINSLYRTQWVGLDGAPETINLNINSPVSERLSLGLSFYNDEIGISQETNIAADVAYTIPLNDNELLLSFGVKGSLNFIDVNFSKLNPNNPIAPEFSPQNNIDNQVSPNLGAGFYLRKSDRWYAGFSIPSLFKTDIYDDTSISVAKERLSLYIIGGYVFDLNPNLKFKPAVLTKATEGAPIAVDVSANFLINNKFTLGAAYRWDAAISGLAGFQINESIHIGYAYDYDTEELGNYNNGSHEIFLRFELGQKSTKQVVSPRFF